MDLSTLKTTSFWVAAATQVAMIASALAGFLPAQYAFYFAAAAAAAYGISRTITKYRADFKRGYHTTEFYLALISVAIGAVTALEGDIPASQLAGISTVLAAAYAVMRAMQTARLVDYAGTDEVAVDTETEV